MKKQLRAVDWKFWLSMTLAMCVGYLAFIGYAAVQDGREKDRQINALIRTAKEKDRAAERRDALAARERIAAAEAQEALLAYTRSLANRQRAVLAYLRRNGVDLPVRLVEGIEPPRIVLDSGNSGGSTNDSSSGGHRDRKARHRAPRTRDRVDLPGRSEDAPGRDKRRGRR